MTLRVEVHPLPGGRLLDDYRAGKPELLSFYAGNPYDPDAYRRKLEEVRGRFGEADRRRAAAALTPASERARKRLERFVREGGAMVTTGQQAGLFTGPLYTVHKALTALRLAEALERELDTVVLPVFWIASEDHDFAEVDHAHAVGGEGELRRVGVHAREADPYPMGWTELAEDVESASAEYLHAVAAEDDAGSALVRSVLAGYRTGATVAGAFREAVLTLFRDFDLCVTSADDPALKAASVPVLLGEAERAAEHERLVAERTIRLEAAGYPAQVELAEGATNLFYQQRPGGRDRLLREGAGLVAPALRERFTAAELEAEIRARPELFSPNVLLRPVVESAVFPTLAYVGGPAEVAYFAQMGPLFSSFGIRMPLVFPRWAATVVPEEAEAALRGLGLERGELARPEHELLERLARRRIPPEVEERLRALRRALVEGFGGVMDAARAVDPNLDGALGSRRNRALLEVAEAERKVLRHYKKRHPALARDLRLARSHLRPLGLPQERVLTVLQYLARDPGLLRRLAEAMEVRLGAGAPAGG